MQAYISPFSGTRYIRVLIYSSITKLSAAVCRAQSWCIILSEGEHKIRDRELCCVI